MLERRYVALILVLISTMIVARVYYYTQRAKPSKTIYSGFWMPENTLSPESMVNLTQQMTSRIQGSTPGNLWAVGRIETSRGKCVLRFPSNQTYPHMFFDNEDRNEDYLTAFDDKGIKVWLEVEPGFADINQLIDLVLKRYENHSCILGFSVDLEWRWGLPDTRVTVPVTDEEANQWLNKTKFYNPNYKLLLIHWLPEVMPPTAREGIVFIDDAQNFEGLDSLVDEFKSWGENFSETDVGFIFGYERDLEWLSKIENPPKEIGSALIQTIPNCRFVFWSYETILEVFPLS